MQTQLLGILTQIPDLSGVRDLRSGLALRVDEVFDVNETVVVRVETAEPRLELEATITEWGTRRAGGPHALHDRGDGSYELELPGRRPGDYTITVAGSGTCADLVQPVSDAFVVVPEDPEVQRDGPAGTGGR